MPVITGNTLREILACGQTAPKRPACLFLDRAGKTRSLTYGALRGQVLSRAGELAALPPTSRIGLIAPHGPDFLIDALAILQAGHCLVPVNGQLPASDIAEILSRSAAHALWRHAGPLEILTPSAPRDDSHSPAYLRFTSGSTGRRKGVLLGHRTIDERTAAANARLGVSPADRVLCLLPMVDHFVVSILLYLRYGATILLVENERDALAFASSEKATLLYGSPTQYRLLLDTPGDFSLTHARLAISTTQGLSTGLATRFLARFGLPLTQALGIIEAGLLTLNDELAREKPLLAGKPMPAYRLSIVDAAGALLPVGKTGEIHVAGPGLLDAYVSPWTPREKLLRPHGFATGDHGWLDKTGCLHLAGRRQNLLVIHGRTFYCEEIEAVLNNHPAVRESLVSLKNGILSARIVTGPASPDLDELTIWTRNQLPPDAAPQSFQVVDSLPRTATGKLRRSA